MKRAKTNKWKQSIKEQLPHTTTSDTSIQDLAAKKLLKTPLTTLKNKMINNTFWICCMPHEEDWDIWKHPDLAGLVTLGIKHRPKPGKVRLKDAERAGQQLVSRAIGRFKQAIYKRFFEECEIRLRDKGLRAWRPLKPPLDNAGLLRQNQEFFAKSHHLYAARVPNFQGWAEAIGRELPRTIMNLQKGRPAARSFSSSENNILIQLKRLRCSLISTDKNMGYAVCTEEYKITQTLSHLESPKGTYEVCQLSFDEIMQSLLDKFMVIFHTYSPTAILQNILNNLKVWVDWTTKYGKLCGAYPIPKKHKPGNTSRLINPNINYPTAGASKFLSDFLTPSVNKHPRILKNTGQLVSKVSEIELDARDPHWVFAADVTQLYPSMDLGRTIDALRWFLNNHCSKKLSEHIKEFIIQLALYVLRNAYIYYRGKRYLQRIGTAMGTIASVPFANIYMLKLEDAAFNRFEQFIVFGFRFLDDYAITLTGQANTMVKFRQALQDADRNIDIEWQNHLKPKHAFIEDKMIRSEHQKIVYMDTIYEVADESVWSETQQIFVKKFNVSPYTKPNNKFTYIAASSSHSKECKIGWYKGEVLRALIHCDRLVIWLNECACFADRLVVRGHKWHLIRQAFKKVKWGYRNKILEDILLNYKKDNTFLDRHKGLVFSIQEFPGHKGLAKEHLQLQWLNNGCCDKSMFPEEAAIVFKSPSTLGRRLPK
jgi:hypothetical protein